jgi:hypothetical protein
MSKQITLTIYTFSELSNKAKDVVRQRQMEGGYFAADDTLASLKAMAEHFGTKVENYSIDFFGGSYSYATFTIVNELPDESDIARLLAELGTFDAKTLKGHGECKLTGYCADEDAIDGFRQAWRAGERNLEKLLQAGFKTWLKAAQADCASQFEDEQLSENCDANDMMFYANGNVFHESDVAQHASTSG